MAETLIAQLNKDSELILKGVADERLPSVLDGLVAHYPFDGTITTNLIDYDEGIYNHLQDTIRQYDIDKPVYSGEIYNIAGCFSRNVVHAGRCYFMIRLETIDGTLIDGTMGLVDGWGSVSGEALYHYFDDDIDDYVGYYGFYEHDFEIPAEAHGGKIVWVKLVFVNDSISDTTSYKNISFGKKYHRNFHPTYEQGIGVWNDGISVERPTINVIETDLSEYVVHSYDGNTCDSEIIYINGVQTLHLFNVAQPTNSWYPRIVGPYFDSTVTGNVTYGLTVKSSNNGQLMFRCYEAGATKVTQYISPNKNFNRYKETFDTTYVLDRGYFVPQEGNEYWIQMPQIENKRFASSFVDGSRTITGELDLPIPPKTNYTICFEFSPLVPNDFSEYVNLVVNSNPYTNNFIMWKRTYETYYRIRIGGSDYTFSPSDIVQYGKYHIVLVVGDTSTKIYLNGVYKGTIAKTVSLEVVAIGYAPGSFNGDNKFYSLSFYDKELSEGEIKKLSSKKMILCKNGDMLNAEIKESVIKPSDVFYFPLDINTREVSGACKARDESNLRFDDGAFVGLAGINNILDDIENWVPVRPSVEYVDVPFGTGKGVKYSSGCLTSTWSGNAYCYQDHDTPETIGVKYQYGAWCYVSEDCDLTWARLAMEHCVSGSAYYDLTKKGTWQFLQLERTSVDSTYDNCRFLTYLCKENHSTSDFNGYVIFSQPIAIQASDHIVPVDNGLSRSYLNYNLHEDLGLDWSSDWSLVYFKKPFGTSAYKALTGYSIESLGGGGASNDTNGGYVWWGKASGSDNLSSFTPSAITPSTYFGKYHMVSLVYDSTANNIKIKTWLPEYVCVRDYSLDTANAAKFVNDYGIDLYLGGYTYNNADHACCTSFRDLIVAQRQFTDDELGFINKSMMQNNSKGNLVLRKLKENIL